MVGRVKELQDAAAPASATAWSCSPEPPLTPTAPTTFPSDFSGIPPAKIMIRLHPPDVRSFSPPEYRRDSLSAQLQGWSQVPQVVRLECYTIAAEER